MSFSFIHGFQYKLNSSSKYNTTEVSFFNWRDISSFVNEIDNAIDSLNGSLITDFERFLEKKGLHYTLYDYLNPKDEELFDAFHDILLFPDSDKSCNSKVKAEDFFEKVRKYEKVFTKYIPNFSNRLSLFENFYTKEIIQHYRGKEFLATRRSEVIEYFKNKSGNVEDAINEMFVRKECLLDVLEIPQKERSSNIYSEISPLDIFFAKSKNLVVTHFFNEINEAKKKFFDTHFNEIISIEKDNELWQSFMSAYKTNSSNIGSKLYTPDKGLILLLDELTLFSYRGTKCHLSFSKLPKHIKEAILQIKKKLSKEIFTVDSLLNNLGYLTNKECNLSCTTNPLITTFRFISEAIRLNTNSYSKSSEVKAITNYYSNLAVIMLYGKYMKEHLLNFLTEEEIQITLSHPLRIYVLLTEKELMNIED